MTNFSYPSNHFKLKGKIKAIKRFWYQLHGLRTYFTIKVNHKSKNTPTVTKHDSYIVSLLTLNVYIIEPRTLIKQQFHLNFVGLTWPINKTLVLVIFLFRYKEIEPPLFCFYLDSIFSHLVALEFTKNILFKYFGSLLH